MIKSIDLRIGNFVKDKKGVILTVYGVAISDGKNIIWYDKEAGFYLEDYEIDPIPLTPDILEACGFVKKTDSAPGIGDFHWYDNGDYETIRVYNDWITLKGVESVPIKYLHHLQNLIFALTGQELTVNLPQPAEKNGQ